MLRPYTSPLRHLTMLDILIGILIGLAIGAVAFALMLYLYPRLLKRE